MPSDGPLRYGLAGTTVACEIELPGLTPGSGAARWCVRLEDGDPPDIGIEYHCWQHAWGEIWLRFLRAGDERRLIFPGALDVFVSEARAEARCFPHAGVALDRVRQLVAHQVLPLLLGCDRLVLHASAVALDDRVLAFAGGTGEGKSTLVSYLAGRGGLVVSDDALVVAGGEAITQVAPWRSPIRLAADSIGQVLGDDPGRFRGIREGTEKHAVPLPPAPDRLLRLHRVYILEKALDAGGDVREVSQARAIRDLMQATFEIAADDPARVALTFDRVTRVVRDAPVRVLCLPHRYEQLSYVAALIAEDMR